jgi:ubiquinone biosynthesis protein UbiJ
MMPPLLSSAANAALEAQLRILLRCDPFWHEHLNKLNGLRLKLVLTDIGFKRVFQFGPTQLHLAAPFTQADVTLTTQSMHLPKLRDAQETSTAIDEGHFYIIGNPHTFEQIVAQLRCFDLDWEAQLARILPGGLAYQIRTISDIAFSALQQTKTSIQDSYRFWRDNEHHGK